MGMESSTFYQEDNIGELFLVQVLAHYPADRFGAHGWWSQLHRRSGIRIKDVPLAFAVVLCPTGATADEEPSVHHYRHVPGPASWTWAIDSTGGISWRLETQEPRLFLRIVHMHVVEASRGVAGAAKEVETITDDGKRHACSGLWRIANRLQHRPDTFPCVEDIQIVEPLSAIPATKYIQPKVIYCRSMVCPRRGLLARRLDRVPGICCQVEAVQVIQIRTAVSSAEDQELSPYQVCGVHVAGPWRFPCEFRRDPF
mmetsp:Transcript_99490/g.179574  ORF Transcript_99490/g.179574 Transcript_99490/m.179574 type:complete len:256 (-) Transcript_99490:8-775(-)